MQAGRGQLHLQALDDRARPGLGLLEVVHAKDGLLGQEAHPVGEVDPQDLIRPPAGRHRRQDDLGPPPRGLGLRHAAQAIGPDAEQSLAGGGVEAGGDLGLQERGVREFRVTDLVVRMRRSRPGGLADQHQRLDRHAGPIGQLSEGHAAERGEPLVGRFIEEVQRDLATADGVTEAIERDARCQQAVHHPDATDGPAREAVALGRGDDAQLDQAAQLGDVDAGPLGGLGERVRRHAPYCSGARRLDSDVIREHRMEVNRS